MLQEALGFMRGPFGRYMCIICIKSTCTCERALTRVPLSDVMVWQRRAVHAGPCPVEQVRAGRH